VARMSMSEPTFESDKDAACSCGTDLWRLVADKYLKSKNVDWAQQREKCFCEEWREDDEELGIQIVKVSSSHGQVILQGIIEGGGGGGEVYERLVTQVFGRGD